MLSNLLLEQSKVVLLFPLFVVWALLVRKEDPETHKRLIILATLLPLPAAFDRMTWLPMTQPDSPTSIHLYYLLWLSPALIYDVWGAAACTGPTWSASRSVCRSLPFRSLPGGTDWWLATGPKIFGIQSW